MANIPPLALSDIVDISVSVSPAAAVAPTFNQGLITGNSGVIPSYGANARLRQYANTDEMLTDGFISSDPEYLAAQLYFNPTPAAQFVWIGAVDSTAIQTAIVHTGNAGTGYVVGDQVTVVQSGASHGVLTVLSIGGGGAVATLGTTIGNQGTAYSTATGLATTGGSGTGLEVDITAIGETQLQAAQACRQASNAWYGLTLTGGNDADMLAVGTWATGIWETTRFYPYTATANVPNGVAGNLALQMQALKLKCVGIYATTQSGLYPNNVYAASALMGVEMGLNTGLAGSFFTLAHKALVGIAPEPLTETQYGNLRSQGWNAYCNFSPYSLFEPGFSTDGQPSYLWLNLAMLVANLQINELNVLASLPVVPQTNPGQRLLLDAADAACATANSIGFLATGVWDSQTVLNLSSGQPVPNGYLNQSQSYAAQSKGDRAAGKAMPIYTAITTAGAVQSLVIAVYTQL